LTFQEIVGLFGARRVGREWKARCPAHDDRTPSLSIAEGKDGRALLVCRSHNCPPEAICAGRGIRLADLFVGRNGDSKARRISRVAEAYDYMDENGALLYQNVRLDPKDFKMRRPNGRGGWIKNLDGVRRVLYRLPEVIAADSLLVVEGEKDVHAAEKLGFVATSSKQFRPEFAELLRGKRVAIIADADDAGRKTAKDVARALTGKVTSLKLCELPGAGKDLSHWAEAGGTKEALAGFIECRPEWKPELEWREIFHTFAEFENAPPLSFAIRGILQNDAATVVGGLAGHDKTWILLSIAKALLKGKGAKLWGEFEVLETAQRVLYFIPESTIGPFGHRLRLLGMYEYVRDGRLVVRTLSKGATIPLSDPRVLAAAPGAYVLIDTLARFTEGDENSAAEFQALATDIFGLLGAGARGVVPAHHSPKSFAKENFMLLEAMLRGSGDIGAIFATAWGVKQIDKERNVLHVENLKARDFEPSGPFELIGRPYIDEEGDFRMHKKPGDCGPLAEEQPTPERNRGGGAAEAVRRVKAANLALMRGWLVENPNLSLNDLVRKFADSRVKIDRSSVSRYKDEMRRALNQ